MQTVYITDNENNENNSCFPDNYQQQSNKFHNQNNYHQHIPQVTLTPPLQFTINPQEQLSIQPSFHLSQYPPTFNDYFNTPPPNQSDFLSSVGTSPWNHQNYNSTPSEHSFCSLQISEILPGSEYAENNEQVVYKVEREISQEKAHPVHLNPFKCRFCNELFPIVTNLRSHVQKVHSDIFLRELAKCKKKADITIEHSGKPSKRSLKKGHACEHCQKSFMRKQDLKRHLITHIDGLKPYVCDVCQVTFTRSDALNRHVKSQRCTSKF
ncbi:hypothetical protein HK096_001991 [Nowakowskiella sp. JEL0078]|nr:hypothetical protein HK096_001991 [Nowakowskiella sp. JEL0078]